MLFDEFATGFDFVAHEDAEHGGGGVHAGLAQRAVAAIVGVHRSFHYL